MRFSGKKIFLVGFLVILLVGIPTTIFLVQQNQEVRSRAEKSTTISFTPDSSTSAPLQKKIGDTIPLDIMVDPGTNLVSFVKLEIQYDPEKLATTGATTLQPNIVAFPTTLEGPVYSPGKISVTLSVGPDPTKAIQAKVKAATINLKAIANTPADTPTVVTYGATTQVLSIGSNDEASENVLSNTVPATILIGDAAPTDGPTAAVTEVPTPTTALPTDQPTTAPNPTSPPADNPTSSPAPTDPGGTATASQPPTCSSLTVDRETNGAAPFAITFTVNGTDSDGTISKATFNFGDGEVSDVTNSGGIGTNQVNAQVAHTYNNPGTYQASAILTDDTNGVSDSASCIQTISVTEGSASNSANTNNQSNNTSSQSATIPPTGMTEVAMGIGAAAFFLIMAGAVLFFIF